MKELTIEKIKPEHRQFAALVADGVEVGEAYKEAMGEKAREPFKARGWELQRRPLVADYILYLREITRNGTVLSLVEKREILATVVRNEELSFKERMSALELDNKMAGHDAPERKQVSISSDTPIINLTISPPKQEKRIEEIILDNPDQFLPGEMEGEELL